MGLPTDSGRRGRHRAPDAPDQVPHTHDPAERHHGERHHGERHHGERYDRERYDRERHRNEQPKVPWDEWPSRFRTPSAPVSPAVTADQTAMIPAQASTPAPDQTAMIPAQASTPAPDQTAMIPAQASTPAADETGVVPAATAARSDETGLMGIVPAVETPSGEDDLPPPQPRSGEQVVPLRAVHTHWGYRSVHSALTRVTAGTVIRTSVRGLGELLITLGVIVLLLAAYEVWGKAAIVASHQEDLDRQLAQAWAGEPGPDPTVTAAPGDDEDPQEAAEEPSDPLGPPPGHALARVYAPTIGKYWIVVEGVQPADIRYAPGHYPDTAMPGEVGNFSVAGHRNPATFWDLDKIREGDPIVVETRDTWYTYHVTRNYIVPPDAVEVVAPVPGDPAATPTEVMLTLTTCNPKWDNSERLIVHAELDPEGQTPQSEGRPAVLGGLGA